MNAIAEKLTLRSGRCVEPENFEGSNEFFDDSAGRIAGARTLLASTSDSSRRQMMPRLAGAKGWLVLTIESGRADR